MWQCVPQDEKASSMAYQQLRCKNSCIEQTQGTNGGQISDSWAQREQLFSTQGQRKLSLEVDINRSHAQGFFIALECTLAYTAVGDESLPAGSCPVLSAKKRGAGHT